MNPDDQSKVAIRSGEGEEETARNNHIRGQVAPSPHLNRRRSFRDTKYLGIVPVPNNNKSEKVSYSWTEGVKGEEGRTELGPRA